MSCEAHTLTLTLLQQAHTLTGMRVGVCQDYFNHADPRIVARGRAMLKEMVAPNPR